jgi:hypothetical protein
MAKTKIANVIVPEVFNPYIMKALKDQSMLIKAGIVVPDPKLDALALAGGKLINMPFWNDLDGDDEVLGDSTALDVAGITAGQDVAVLLMRGKAWSVNDLATALSGDDPMKAIGDLLVRYWLAREQDTLVKLLTGAFSASNATNKLDISAATGEAALISGETFIDAKTVLGDNAKKLTAVAMHSAVFAYLEKQNLISYIPDSNGVVDFPTYQNKRVIVDDGLPYNSTTKVATSYLFGEGAIGRGEGQAPVPTETDRDSLAGDDILINRRHFILHPRGIKFTNTSVTGVSPTNTELANASNWSQVYEKKDIRIVQFTHKIA